MPVQWPRICLGCGTPRRGDFTHYWPEFIVGDDSPGTSSFGIAGHTPYAVRKRKAHFMLCASCRNESVRYATGRLGGVLAVWLLLLLPVLLLLLHFREVWAYPVANPWIPGGFEWGYQVAGLWFGAMSAFIMLGFLVRSFVVYRMQPWRRYMVTRGSNIIFEHIDPYVFQNERYADELRTISPTIMVRTVPQFDNGWRISRVAVFLSIWISFISLLIVVFS